jgi:hypothetical protein
MDVRLPSTTHRVPFRFRENLARLSKDLHESGPLSLDTVFAAQGADFTAELACPTCGIVLSDAARLACGSCAS